MTETAVQPAPDRSTVGGNAWAPLKHPLFRAMWIAMTISNVGTWMQDLGASWLMTSLTTSSLMVALVQTAVTLPLFLLAYPAGVLADIIDRRIWLLVMHVWLLMSATTLALLTFGGAANAWLLLAFTFALGVGNALMRPAWAASVPDFVPKEEIRNAVTLNSMSTNVCRAVGPAIAGVVISMAGVAVVFAFNAASFTVLLITLWRLRWNSRAQSGSLPVERFLEGVTAGLRYARHTPALYSVLARSLGFFLFASAAWALLPVIAIRVLGASADTYGLMMAALGIGAILGAVLLPMMHRHLSREAIVLTASTLYGLSMLIIASSRNQVMLSIALIVSGFGYISVFASLVVAAQLAVPRWVRARGQALGMIAIGGATAAGSALWGYLADQVSVAFALAAAGGGLFVALILTRYFPIGDDEHLDLTPSMHWPTPVMAEDIEPDRGPVMITVEYHVTADQVDRFMSLMQQMRRIRRRDAAFFWEVFNDVSQPNRYVEVYMVESWIEHMRQHERVTVSDRVIQDQLYEFLDGRSRPQATHYVAGQPANYGD